MNKRAFTLIELLAIIVVLSIIALITTPIILSVVENSKTSVTEEQRRLIEGAAERYVTDNYGTDISCITLKNLREAGYLKSSDTNSGVVKITYDDDNNQYTYSYDNSGSCS